VERVGGCDAGAEAEIAQRIVRYGRAAIGEAPDILAVDPDRVGRAEAGAEQTERVEVRGEAPAIARSDARPSALDK